MNTNLDSPISDSRHHNPTTPNSGKKPNGSKVVIIAVAVLVFAMGLSFFLFLGASDQQEEQMVEPIEAY